LLIAQGTLATIPEQAWGYINVNSTYDSNMFWWLYGSTGTPSNEAPLVMWLQGGPGATSLYGDFMEIGPKDVYGKPRNTTWLNSANLLFVDNPVGTGFSYTNDIRGYSTTDQEIADNLVLLMIGFLQKYPVFETMPFWIFCESYGGKMTANFAVALDKAIKADRLTLTQFKGVALGDSWVAPIDCMYSYPTYLYAVSLVDQVEADNLTAYAKFADEALNTNNNGVEATGYWGEQQSYLEYFAGGPNIYNWMYYDDYLPDNQFSTLMENTIRKQLGDIPTFVNWTSESTQVFVSMEGAFMTPAISSVDYLLNAGYQVNVYSGQLDIIVDVICIESWMSQLTWSGTQKFSDAHREFQYINGTPQGYKQSYENLALWGIYKAGHMVPADNGPMALLMLNSIIGK